MAKTLCIFGSRTLKGGSVRDIIIKEIGLYKPETIITSGNTCGVCEEARQISKQLCIPLKVHFIDNDKYAAGKYEHRSKAILKETDFCIFIHDGKSKGTSNEIKMCEKLGIEYKYHKLSDSEFVNEFGFNGLIFDFA